ADPAKSGLEFFLTNEEGVVLGRDLPGGLGEVQRDGVVGLDHEKMRKPGCRRQAKDPGQERRRPLLVTARDDGVVQLHAHPGDCARPASSANDPTAGHPGTPVVLPCRDDATWRRPRGGTAAEGVTTFLIRAAVPGDMTSLRGVSRRSSPPNEGDRMKLLA